MSMIEKVQGFWLCECGSLNPDEYSQCLSPNCYEHKPIKPPQSRKRGYTSVSDIPLSVDSPKQTKTGSNHDTQDFTTEQIQTSYKYPVALPKTKRSRSQKWLYKGLVLDSTPEKERMLYLEWLETCGTILELKRPEAFEIRKRLIIPANDIHSKITQAREVYTPDFVYRYNGYLIYEDVKAERFIKQKDGSKKLKPKLERGTSNKVKRLQEMLVQENKQVFLFTVFHGGVWHYFNSNQNEIEFSLVKAESKAA